MKNDYEQRMVNALSIDKYIGNMQEKLSLVEIASQMFLVTDFKLGEVGQTKDNFAKVFSELIGAKKEDNMPMNMMIATKTFGFSEDAIMDYNNARLFYESRKDKFDAAFLPICAYGMEKYPELRSKEVSRSK